MIAAISVGPLDDLRLERRRFVTVDADGEINQLVEDVVVGHCVRLAVLAGHDFAPEFLIASSSRSFTSASHSASSS